MSHKNKKNTIKQIGQLIFPYWKSREALIAWPLLVFVISINLAIVYLNVKINYWNNDLYNSLQDKDQLKFYALLPLFLFYASFFVVFVALNNYFSNLLSFRWRYWLTTQYIHKWTENHSYYRMMLEKEPTDNPDQRISQDLKEFASTTLNLFITIIEQTVTIVSFSLILWNLSGTLAITLVVFGDINIHGYMFWAAFIYAVFGTYIGHFIGRKLIPLNYEQEKREADFRYRLIRFREKREEIAFLNNKNFEINIFGKSFTAIKDNFYSILKQAIYLNGWQTAYVNASTIFPILVMSPKFFAGTITLGTLMQISGAFGRVENSFATFLLQYQTLASWRAVTKRLIGFNNDIENVVDPTIFENEPVKIIFKENQDSLIIEDLSIYTPEHVPLLRKVNFSVKPKEKLLLQGMSGIGKSTILRVLSGLWPFGEGIVSLPKDKNIMIIPQRPYLPLGTLREVLLYTIDDTTSHFIKDRDIHDALSKCGLGYFIPYLDETSDWTNALSLGEQQRINFVRILLTKPDWVILDEPTASMDKKTEKKVFQTLLEYCPELTIITVGHSDSLKVLHDKVIDMTQWSDKQQSN